MIIKNISNGELLENINLQPTKKIYSTIANEAEVESIFEEFLRDLGYGGINSGFWTKRSSKNKLYTFPSKSGDGHGYPDYIFYENKDSDSIIAVGDVKTPSPEGDNSINGLNDCINIYLKEYNKKHISKIKIAFGYDGINFVIKYLSDENTNKWSYIKIDENILTTLPQYKLLKSISQNGNIFSTQIEKNVSKELLEPYFAQCDRILRHAKIGASAIEKATEVSTLIFLKIFSEDKLDSKFIEESGCPVWEAVEKGKITTINKVFREFLNKEYQSVFPEKIILVDKKSATELATVINAMFRNCKINKLTDVKGNALEYFQKESKDKKIGQFFTPRHLVNLIIYLINPQIRFKKTENDFKLKANGDRIIENIETIYDPCCGSGGFLIQAFNNYLDKYGKYGVKNTDIKQNVIFGNELKSPTVMLTKLNMILLGDGHNHISNESAISYLKVKKIIKQKMNNKIIEIPSENIIYKKQSSDYGFAEIPYNKLTNERVFEESNKESKENKKYYKAVVDIEKDGITPRFEYKNVMAVNEKVRKYHQDFFGKFDIVMSNHPYGLDEPTKPDELFVRHMIDSVRNGGRIGCIVGETLLFHKNYKLFREWMLENVTVESIISLPQGVFNPYTDVKTSILLIKKEKPPINHKTWLVDIENDGFELSLTRAPKKGSNFPKLKKLWENWGGYYRRDESGKDEYISFHKEETGFAEFHTLDKNNWCVKRYNTPLISLNSRYQLRPISDILLRYKDTVSIEDDKEYQQITIQVKNNGIIPRKKLKGINIGTKNQFVIRKNTFVISKIDARNGAYGLVPENLDGAIITGNFWAFTINKNLVYPEYLTYLMRNKFFLTMCKVCSYGSTNRWYLDEDTFMNFKIPIPDKNKLQKKILEKINNCNKEIEKAKQTIENEESKISDIISDVLY